MLAFKIAGIYAIAGLLWILLSDRLVMAVTSFEYQQAILQSMKGGVFILLSSLLIFLLVGTSLQRWSQTRSELEVAVEQADRLHRILRHNLRNSCQVISGNAELLAEDTVHDEAEQLQRIRDQNDRLIALSRKSVFLRDFLDTDTSYVWEKDLAEIVRTEVADARERYPEATITLGCPEHAPVSAHKYIGKAVRELVENAVVHNEATDPEVDVTVRTGADGVSVTVTDDGPGIPPVERWVLDRKTETTTKHSQGLGLWLVYLTVRYSEGTLTVTNRDEGGARVQFTLPAA